MWYVEEVADRLAGSDLIHLTFFPLPPVMATAELTAIVVTGLPPAVCVTMWSKHNPSPWIPVLDRCAGRSTTASYDPLSA